jgi:hypothetical protein
MYAHFSAVIFFDCPGIQQDGCGIHLINKKSATDSNKNVVVSPSLGALFQDRLAD